MSGANPPARRSDFTKAAILAAARERFAAQGYQATVRGIAAVAGVDPALVIRYFGSKEALFATAAEFDLRLPDVSGIPRADTGSALVAHFLDRWEGDETLMALLRAAVNHEAAALRMEQIFATQLAPMVARLRGGPRGVAAARAGLVASQMLGMALCRYVLKLPPVVALRRDEVIRQLGPTIQRYLFEV